MKLDRSKGPSLSSLWGPLYLMLGLWMVYSGYRRLSVLPMQDTMLTFDSFYWYYNSLSQGLGIPELLMQGCFGTAGGFYPLTFISPASSLVMAAGWVFGIQDAFVLFTTSVILDQFVYVGGMALACSRFSLSPRATFLACLGAALTVVSHFQYPFNFRTFAYLPLCLWALLGFVETKTLCSLMVFAVCFVANAMGTVQYAVPMSLLLLCIFAVVVWSGPMPGWRRLRPYRFHTLLWGLLAAVMAIAYLAQVFHALRDVVSMSPGRDPVTMAPIFESFARMAASIDFKDLILQYLLGKDCFSNSNWYVGIVPWVCIITATFSCRSRPFWACLVCVGLMLAFSCAGVLSLFIFNLPTLNFFRHPGWFLSATKPFLLLAFALSLDHLAKNGITAVKTAFKICLGAAFALLCFDLLGSNSMREDIIKMMMAGNGVLNPILAALYFLFAWGILKVLRSDTSANFFLYVGLVFCVEMFSVQWCIYKGEVGLPVLDPRERDLLLTLPVRIDSSNQTDVQNVRQLELKSLLTRSQSNYPIQFELMGLSPCLNQARYEVIDAYAYRTVRLRDKGATPSWFDFATSCGKQKVRFAAGPRYYGSTVELERQVKRNGNKPIDWIENAGNLEEWPGFVDFPQEKHAELDDFLGTDNLGVIRYDATSNAIVHTDLLTPHTPEKSLLRFGSKRLFHWQVHSDDVNGNRGILFSFADMPNLFFLSNWEGERMGEPQPVFDFHVSSYGKSQREVMPLETGQFDFRSRKGGGLNFFHYDNQLSNALYLTDAATGERKYVAPLQHGRPVQRRYLDLNGDGLEDVALINDSHILFALARPTGGFDTLLYSGGRAETFYNICFADVNGDGLKDIVALKGEHIWVSLNRGDGFDQPNIWFDSLPPESLLLHGEFLKGGAGVFCLLSSSTASFVVSDGKRFNLGSQTQYPGLELLAKREFEVRPDKQDGFTAITVNVGPLNVLRFFDTGIRGLDTLQETVPLPPLGHDGALISEIELTPKRLEFSWDRPASSTPWVIVSLAYNPHWKLTLDGRPGEVHRANGGLMALRVPTGTGRAVLEYKYPARQVAVTAYALASLAAGFLLVSLTIWTFLKLIRNGKAPTPVPWIRPEKHQEK